MSAPSRTGGAVIGTCEALEVADDVARFGAARVASLLGSRGVGGAGTPGPLRHRRHLSEPALPGPGWMHLTPLLAGICGSDLATLSGRASRWFEPIVSLPFVPGHEVVAETDGRRVVLEPVLGCVARGIDPVCGPCAAGDLGRCGNLGHGSGHVDAGLQTGFCCDTGGGWSTRMVAHASQLHDVPADMDDATAVMVEPAACAVHAALAVPLAEDGVVAVLGAGTMGLLVAAALNRWNTPGTLVVAARHPEQRRWVAELHPAATAVADDAVLRAVRRATGTRVLGEGRNARLAGGADVTFDCVGSRDSLTTAVNTTRPGGTVVLVGMPGVTTVDLTPLWQREVSVRGAYTYGTEVIDGSPVRTFGLAMELAAAARLGRLVTATYPLDRSTEAIAHAADAGRRGAVKVAFAPGRTRP